MPWIYVTPFGPSAPISDSELRDLVADGTIVPQTKIKREGGANGFTLAGNIKGLKFPESDTGLEQLHQTTIDNAFAPHPLPSSSGYSRKYYADVPTLKQTLNKYYTPTIIEWLWVLSYIVYALAVVISLTGVLLVVSNGGSPVPLILPTAAVVVGGFFYLVAVRISLECACVLFDIALHLKIVASKYLREN